MIIKSDRELELEKRLEGIKGDLEAWIEWQRTHNIDYALSMRTKHMEDEAPADDMQTIIDKHFPTEYEEGTIE